MPGVHIEDTGFPVGADTGIVAVAAPIPEAAPVITAIFPANRPFI